MAPHSDGPSLSSHHIPQEACLLLHSQNIGQLIMPELRPSCSNFVAVIAKLTISNSNLKGWSVQKTGEHYVEEDEWRAHCVACLVSVNNVHPIVCSTIVIKFIRYGNSVFGIHSSFISCVFHFNPNIEQVSRNFP